MNEKKYYAIPYISNSTLTWFKVSPRYCWKRMNLEIVDEEKSYTTLGKQIHMNLLEPEEFEKTYTYLDFKTPTSKQQLSFCESVIKQMKLGELMQEIALIEAYKENYVTEKMTDAAILKAAEKIYESNIDYIKYLTLKGDFREILSKSKQELLTTVTNAIKSHKKASRLMFNDETKHSDMFQPRRGQRKHTLSEEAFNEIALYWDYPIYWNGEGIKCKSLLDRLVVDHKNKRVTIVDLKTTAILGDIGKELDSRGYYRQLAFYRLAVQLSKFVPKDYDIEAYIVAVNTQDPYECRVYKLSETEYQKQVEIINELMQAISWHWFTGNWDYSRTYYEGDGTENLNDDNSNQSIERIESDDVDEISFADVVDAG